MELIPLVDETRSERSGRVSAYAGWLSSQGAQWTQDMSIGYGAHLTFLARYGGWTQ